MCAMVDTGKKHKDKGIENIILLYLYSLMTRIIVMVIIRNIPEHFADIKHVTVTADSSDLIKVVKLSLVLYDDTLAKAEF